MKNPQMPNRDGCLHRFWFHARLVLIVAGGLPNGLLFPHIGETGIPFLLALCQMALILSLRLLADPGLPTQTTRGPERARSSQAVAKDKRNPYDHHPSSPTILR